MIRCALMFLLVSLALQVKSGSTPAVAGSQIQPSSCTPSELNQYDAEILLYVLPVSVAVRTNGRKVAWELQSNPKLNQKDFFTFYVYDLNAPGVSSPTIGYFSINKHTGEVWDTALEKLVDSEDLSAVQKIIRRGHCVGEQVLKDFASRRPGILDSQ